MDSSAIFGRSSDVRYRLVDGEAVVVRQNAGEVMVLSEVGARILDLLDAKTSVAAVIERLAQEFEVDREQLQADVHGFIGELTKVGILEPISAPNKTG